MKNILITGGAGFIGSNLTLELTTKGYNVTVLDNMSKQIHGDYLHSYSYNLIREKARIIIGDVTNISDLESTLNGQDVIIHLAAETGTGQSMYEIDRYTNTNVNGTALLLRLLVNNKKKPQKVIVASSRAIYGEGKYFCEKDGVVYPSQRDDEDLRNGRFECRCPLCNNFVKVVPSDEQTSCNPTSIYGITKLAQEQLVMNTCRSINIPAVSLRFQNVYGPGQSLNNSYTGVLAVFSTLLRNNFPINIFEDGNESRDFVYISDVVSAIILSIEKDEADFSVFNVGTGVPTRILDIADILKASLKSASVIKVSGNYRLGDIRHNVADTSRIKTRLNFIPKVKLSEGLSLFSKWAVSQDNAGGESFLKSINELKERNLFK